MVNLMPPDDSPLIPCPKHPDKVQYHDVGTALEHARRRAPVEGVDIHVYACDVCGLYHLSRRAGSEVIVADVVESGIVYTSESNGYARG